MINAANQLVNPFLQQDYGINLLTAGLYTAVWGIGVIVGGLTGGRLTDRIGQRRAVVVAMIIAIVATLGLASIASSLMAWPLVLIFGLAFGYYETVYFATSMTYTDARIAASMFAILMAIANIGTGIGVALSGVLVDTVGYRPTFAIIAALNLLALPLIPAIFGRRRRAETESVARGA